METSSAVKIGRRRVNWNSDSRPDAFLYRRRQGRNQRLRKRAVLTSLHEKYRQRDVKRRQGGESSYAEVGADFPEKRIFKYRRNSLYFALYGVFISDVYLYRYTSKRLIYEKIDHYALEKLLRQISCQKLSEEYLISNIVRYKVLKTRKTARISF